MFRIELDKMDDQGLQLRMTQMDEFLVLMLYLIILFHISPSNIVYNHVSIVVISKIIDLYLFSFIDFIDLYFIFLFKTTHQKYEKIECLK